MRYPFLKKLENKKIGILGLGLDNQALLALLKKYKIKAEVTIKDFRQDKENYNKNLDQFDILFRSPGWPIACPGIKEALKKGQTKLSSPLNLFFQICPTKKIIGISGTKGKGTTASLIYQIIKDSKQKVFLGGNIGISPLSFVDRIKKDGYVILELSSFQLEDLSFSPFIAVITNLYKEHLKPADPFNPNFHKTYQKYWQAKLNIARQKDNRFLVINEELKNKIGKENISGKIIYFSKTNIKSKLTGDYNQANIGAALKVAQIIKIERKQAEKTISSFKNLEHRLELACEKNDVQYFNNSFATTPESTILDLKSFSSPIIQIAGGADKGACFKSLAKEIKKKVKFLILLPGAGSDKIKKELSLIKFPSEKLQLVNDMSEALRFAKREAIKGDVILLSTGCASFGIFKNYKERGELFKKYARE